MGYRSEVTIALHETVVDRNLITQEIPRELLEGFVTKVGNHSYYQFVGIKWMYYATIIEFFKTLQDVEYGGVRLGENSDDHEYFGCHDDYELYITSYISSPIP